jgi:hypothetical protein
VVIVMVGVTEQVVHSVMGRVLEEGAVKWASGGCAILWQESMVLRGAV